MAGSMDSQAISAYAAAVNSSARTALAKAQTDLSALLVAPRPEATPEVQP